MLSSLKIENYRLFNHFALDKIARVNLIVGTNNSGKSSLLEAIYLLTSNDPFTSLLYVLSERGEYYARPNDPRSENRFGGGYLASHIFYGHRLDQSNAIFIRGNSTEQPSLKIGFGESRASYSGQRTLFEEEPSLNGHTKGLIFELKKFGRVINDDFVPLAEDVIPRNYRRVSIPEQESRLITISSFEYDELSRFWDSITLTPREEKVIEALRIIEPKIERISFTSRQSSSSGILLRFQGEKEPIPLSSMGDGMRRVLAIAASLVSVDKGTLLVDEIDTGLYYAVQRDMWQIIFETARKEDAQVFATTHSWDCVKAFQQALDTFPDQKVGQLLRIQKSGNALKAVRYSATELDIAIQQGIEVR